MHNDYIEDYLMHYGVLGMKWGHHKGGTSSSERKEVRDDNKDAYIYGKAATILSNAAYKASKRHGKLSKKLIKEEQKVGAGNTSKKLENLRTKQKAAAVSSMVLKDLAKGTESVAKQHVQSLKNKYGNENVKDLKYDKKGRVKERTSNRTDNEMYRSVDLGNMIIRSVTGIHNPEMAIIIGDSSGRSAGNSLERLSYKANLYKQQTKQKYGS